MPTQPWDLKHPKEPCTLLSLWSPVDVQTLAALSLPTQHRFFTKQAFARNTYDQRRLNDRQTASLDRQPT
ncbi:hypothetical protein CGMCC3_g13697 [Colletotrichum fructicola]|nr:uncharacterized protein CGMCC3_g13697 [Colletotrichum fructicola]KAE9570192.1 hypothetical protein CGMCC3_g13697 [Colletotrichum fructicola]